MAAGTTDSLNHRNYGSQSGTGSEHQRRPPVGIAKPCPATRAIQPYEIAGASALYDVVAYACAWDLTDVEVERKLGGIASYRIWPPGKSRKGKECILAGSEQYRAIISQSKSK